MMRLNFDLAARQPYIDADFEAAENEACIARIRERMDTAYS